MRHGNDMGMFTDDAENNSPAFCCPSCGFRVKEERVEEIVDERGSARRYYRCSSCGCWSLWPIPSGADLSRYYESHYYGGGSTKFPGVFERWINVYRKSRARLIANNIGPVSKSVLDVGCGSGAFLSQMQERGFTIWGIELPGRAATRARSIPGINLHLGSLREADYSDGMFRVITMWHVLEHLPDPRDILGVCRRILGDNGKIYIQVPNGDSLQSRWFGIRWLHRDPPRHLVQYSADGLRRMLEKEGFVVDALSACQQEMGLFGMLQGLCDLCMHPPGCLYNLIRSRGRVDVPTSRKVLALGLGIALMPLALVLTLMESLVGRGAVLSVVASRKPTV